MKAFRLIVVAALMLAPAYALAQQPASLTGKVVMPKTSGARLASTDDQGNAVDLGELTELDYRVIADMNGRVQIKNRFGVAGWVDKNNVVSVEDAVYFYTGKIQQNANDSDA